MNFIFVALGGALGSMLRYAISLIPCKMEFPILTFLTNIIGAILIGFIVGIASANDNVSDRVVLFLKTGVCGGFTTFSTFSLEAYNMYDDKKYMLALVYVILSCTFCILGVVCGKKMASIVA